MHGMSEEALLCGVQPDLLGDALANPAAPLRPELGAHVSQCSSCQARLDEARRFARSLPLARGEDDEVAVARSRERLAALLSTSLPAPQPLPFRRRAWLGAFGGLALAASIAAVVVLAGRPPGVTPPSSRGLSFAGEPVKTLDGLSLPASVTATLDDASLRAIHALQGRTESELQQWNEALLAGARANATRLAEPLVRDVALLAALREALGRAPPGPVERSCIPAFLERATASTTVPLAGSGPIGRARALRAAGHGDEALAAYDEALRAIFAGTSPIDIEARASFERCLKLTPASPK
jgi:hypothetical protein